MSTETDSIRNVARSPLWTSQATRHCWRGDRDPPNAVPGDRVSGISPAWGGSVSLRATLCEPVGQEDGDGRQDDDEDRNDIRDRALSRFRELAEHPDGQGLLMTGRERGHDDLIEGKREGQHAPGQKGCPNCGQDDIPESLERIGAHVPWRLDVGP